MTECRFEGGVGDEWGSGTTRCRQTATFFQRWVRGFSTGYESQNKTGGEVALGGVSVVEQLAQAAVRNKRRRQREGAARAAGIAAHEHAPYGTKFEVICSSVHVTA